MKAKIEPKGLSKSARIKAAALTLAAGAWLADLDPKMGDYIVGLAREKLDRALAEPPHTIDIEVEVLPGKTEGAAAAAPETKP